MNGFWDTLVEPIWWLIVGLPLCVGSVLGACLARIPRRFRVLSRVFLMAGILVVPIVATQYRISPLILPFYMAMYAVLVVAALISEWFVRRRSNRRSELPPSAPGHASNQGSA